MDKIYKWIYRFFVILTILYIAFVAYGMYYVINKDLDRIENKK